MIYEIIYNNIFKNIKPQELTNISIEKKFKNDKKLITNYVIYKGLEYFNKNYTYLSITDYSIEKNLDVLENYIYIILKSNISATHPFIIFTNIKSNIIQICMSYGKDKKFAQIQLDKFETLLNNDWKHKITIPEYYALYLLFADSINTRKIDIITHNKFSLLNCNNIKQCNLTINKIKKTKINTIDKQKLIKEKEDYYKKKAINILEKFFYFLDNGNFDEAYKFLKIKKNKTKGRINKNHSYFNKQRIDTFFKSNKKLIGHLQIFIDLYQFIHLITNRIIH